ncbi:MAG TPA: glutamyl-tRNA reductase [Acidimicrobiales bacterium]|nr:glutamyl-tRNA reductase [Acidimicrobiales bacterium]
MSVVVVGLDHHQTPLDVLERVAVPEDTLAKTLAELRDRSTVSEVVVVSTCLRTELYAVVDRFHEGVEALQEFLAAKAGAPVTALSEHLTVRFDDAVTTHLFEVAAGTRSAVLGETEVLGQVRRALEAAEAERAAGPVLSGLFRRAVAVGRRVRTATAISRGSTSLSHVAVELATAHVGGSLAGRRVLVVGAGDMGEGVVSALFGRVDPGALVVANRTVGRAQAMADRVGGRAVALSAIADTLGEVDLVLVSTRSATPVLDAEALAGPAARRAAEGRPPLVVIDLSVPRNVEPAARAVPGVALFDMDHLAAHAELTVHARRAELDAATAIVAEEVERYRADDRARGAAPVVSALRSKVDDLARSELDRHRARAQGLDAAQWAEVESVVRDALAKLLHHPTVALKEAAGTARGERLVEALRALFDL